MGSYHSGEKRRPKYNYYWKDNTGKEVDFLIKEKQRITELIQVCYNVENEQTKKREIDSLIKAMNEFKIEAATVITATFEADETIEHKKFHYLPLHQYLMQ